MAGRGSYFVWLNAGKKIRRSGSAAAEEVDLLRHLIARSDVLVQNLKPGALRKLGLDLTELHQQFPQLISMSISGFAPDGPGHSRKAYDLLMQAESGLSSITGSVHAPGRVGVSLVDIATGQFPEAILGALIQHGNGGRGAALTVSYSMPSPSGLPYPICWTDTGLGRRHGSASPTPESVPMASTLLEVRPDFILSIQNEGNGNSCVTPACPVRNYYKWKARCKDNETRVTNRPFVDTAPCRRRSRKCLMLPSRTDSTS